MSIEEKVKNMALELGANVVGIAPRSRFENAPERSHPGNLLPEFRSIIVYGMALNRGAIEAWFSKRNRRPCVLEQRWILHQLDHISLRISHWLEQQGYRSTYFSANGYYNLWEGWADYSQKHAALAAGLGVLGRSSMVVTPQHGAAIHFSSVITEAELEPDPMMDDDFNPCVGCDMCIDICPTKAMNPKEHVSFVMDGKEFSHPVRNKSYCFWGCSGFAGYKYQMRGRTVGTWAYDNLPIPVEAIKAAEERVGSGQAGIVDAYAEMGTRHPYTMAEVLLTPHYLYFPVTEWCANCQKICVGSMKDRQALLDIHLNSGLVKIPDDPVLPYVLKVHNGELMPIPLPGEEV